MHRTGSCKPLHHQDNISLLIDLCMLVDAVTEARGACMYEQAASNKSFLSEARGDCCKRLSTAVAVEHKLH